MDLALYKYLYLSIYSTCIATYPTNTLFASLSLRKEEHFEKLDFTHEGKAAFVSQVAKMKTHTIPRSHLQFLARTLLDMIEDTISKDSEEVCSYSMQI